MKPNRVVLPGVLLTALSAAVAVAGQVRPAPSLELIPVRAMVPARSPAPAAGTLIHLEAGDFEPLRQRLDFSAVNLEVETGGAPRYGLVQFLPGLSGARKELEAAGVRFFGYVPDNAFQVRLTPETTRLLLGHPSVRWVGEWSPGYKVSPRLWPGTVFHPEVTIVAFPDASADKLARVLEAEFPAVVRTSRGGSGPLPFARMAVPEGVREAFLRRAAALDGVAWIEPYVPVSLHNFDTSGPIQGNAPSPGGRTIFGHQVTGTGQIVAVSDSGCDSDMCFFRNLNGVAAVTDASSTSPPAVGPLLPDHKVIGYWVQPGASAYDNDASCSPGSTNEYHGTHTSATAVGDNSLNPSSPVDPGVDVGDGMAPNAQLLFQDIGDDQSGCLSGLGDMGALFLQALRGGARLHSDSWGSATGGAYTVDDWTVDRFLFDHEEMTIFFSAGNEGRPTPPAIGTTGSPGNAKNAVTVGALSHGTSTSAASYSSRGPTADGRVKPDLMVPATAIVSAAGDSSHSDANCGTKSLSGTSMAAPAAAGAAALLREYFAAGFYPAGRRNATDAMEASAPLVKAVLLNGTLPLPSGGAFGNGDYGWGRVFLDNNLFFDGDARKLRVWNVSNADGLLSGESRTFTVLVPAGQELRVTLVWADPEGTLGSGRSLVNDLDLLVSEGAHTWLGNALGPSGDSAEGGNPDRVNNVEQVRISGPAAAIYSITVRGWSVPGNGRSYTDRQGFALAASFGVCSGGVTTPPSGLQVASHPVMGADLTFAPAGGSVATQVYRAEGGCSAAIGTFHYIGSASGSTYTDGRAEGGKTYGYRVRGADDCAEGPFSACVPITPAGRCDLLPVFGGIRSAVADSPNCRNRITWGAATAGCAGDSGPITYNIYRSASPGFSPNRDNLRGSVVSATGWDDQGPGFAAGVTYHYVVRAEDGSRFGNGPHGGNEDPNLIHLFATPAGPPGPLGTFTDGGGDGTAWMSAAEPWQITGTQAQSGSYCYHSGPDGATYPPDTCGSLTTPSLALGTGSVLTYWARYNLEFQWDGVVVEISTDGGSTWADLPPTSPAGYPGTFLQTGSPPVNACNFINTQGAFTGPKDNSGMTSWAAYTTVLAPQYAGKTVLIRWRLSTDPGLEFDGFFLDSISVTNVHVPSPCSLVSRTPVPDGAGVPVSKRR